MQSIFTNQTPEHQIHEAIEGSPDGSRFVFDGKVQLTRPIRITGFGKQVIGSSQVTTVLRNDKTDLFEIQGGLHRFENFTAHATAGHVITPIQVMSRAVWQHISLVQESPTHSIGVNTKGNWIDCRFQFFDSQHVLNAEVPSWNFWVGAHAVNANIWQHGRHTFSGNYAWSLESAAINVQPEMNALRDITFEVCNGGCVYAGGVWNFSIRDSWAGDMGDVHRDLFLITASRTGNAVPTNVQMDNVFIGQRKLKDDICDVRIGSRSDWASVSLRHVSVAPQRGRVDYGKVKGVVSECCGLHDMTGEQHVTFLGKGWK